MLFLYDYGDEWRFEVQAIGLGEWASKGRYPKIIATIGEAPPQYTDPDN